MGNEWNKSTENQGAELVYHKWRQSHDILEKPRLFTCSQGPLGSLKRSLDNSQAWPRLLGNVKCLQIRTHPLAVVPVNIRLVGFKMMSVVLTQETMTETTEQGHTAADRVVKQQQTF